MIFVKERESGVGAAAKPKCNPIQTTHEVDGGDCGGVHGAWGASFRLVSVSASFSGSPAVIPAGGAVE